MNAKDLDKIVLKGFFKVGKQKQQQQPVTLTGYFLLQLQGSSIRAVRLHTIWERGKPSFLHFFPHLFLSSTFTSPQQDNNWASQSHRALRSSHA